MEDSNWYPRLIGNRLAESIARAAHLVVVVKVTVSVSYFIGEAVIRGGRSPADQLSQGDGGASARTAISCKNVNETVGLPSISFQL